MKIKIQQLSKTYPNGTQALRDINLEISTGMFGLLGPNGAGKTTLLRILATLLKPSAGWASVDGFNVSDRHQKWVVKQILGYLPQELGLYPNLNVIEFLDYIATLKNLHDPIERSEQVIGVLQTTGLEAKAGDRIRTLSGGMKRRVGIAQALLGNPQMLIVDEPTAGLDPEERVRFRDLLSRLASERIVILSTHIVEDIAQTCNDMGVLHKGRLRFRGSPRALTEAAQGHAWELVLPPEADPDPSWRVVSRLHEPEGQHLRLIGERPASQARPVYPTLEEAYLLLMAGALSDLSIAV
jgi:ABC-2 type transport system ATP-binding protein